MTAIIPTQSENTTGQGKRIALFGHELNKPRRRAKWKEEHVQTKVY